MDDFYLYQNITIEELIELGCPNYLIMQYLVGWTRKEIFRLLDIKCNKHE